MAVAPENGAFEVQEKAQGRGFRPYPMPSAASRPRGVFSRARQWLEMRLFQLYLATALYMLDPWERFLFNALAIAILLAVGHTAVVQVASLVRYLGQGSERAS
eukprot:scaffold644_cov357-Pavlova_lutheri.AAC.23